MQNSKLQAIKNFYPDTWDWNVDYTRRRYQLIDVPKLSFEYGDIERNFSAYRVQQIRRIQNPYIFGPYLLRKEQLLHQNQIVNERTMYCAIRADDLPTALDYNLDSRRYHGSCEKNPILFANIAQAINALSEHSFNMFIIVCKVIMHSHDTYDVIVSERDTERLPQYVVKLMYN